MHDGFRQIEGRRWRRRLGNFITIRDVLKDWPGDVVRLNMLRTHYRQPIDWTASAMEESEKMLAQWFDSSAEDVEPRPADTVVEALCDDLNTPKAIAELHALRGRAGHKSLGATLAFLGFRRTEFEVSGGLPARHKLRCRRRRSRPGWPHASMPARRRILPRPTASGPSSRPWAFRSWIGAIPPRARCRRRGRSGGELESQLQPAVASDLAD